MAEILQTVMTVLDAAGHFPAQVVLVGCTAVDHATELAFADHPQQSQLLFAVAAVFQHHQVDAGLFVGTNQTPAILDVVCTADFHANVLAGLHGGNSHVHVCIPGGVDQHAVHIRRCDHIPVICSALRTHTGSFLDLVLCLGDPVLIGIADPGIFHIFHSQQTGQHAVAATAETNDTSL